MATTWTTDDLAALESAIKSGVTSVEYADKKVTYRSLDEMLRLLALMKRELGQSTRTTRLVLNVDKGL